MKAILFYRFVNAMEFGNGDQKLGVEKEMSLVSSELLMEYMLTMDISLSQIEKLIR